MNGKINCQICGKECSQITPAHLRTHNITVADYKNKFPEAPIRSELVSGKVSATLQRVASDSGKRVYNRTKVSLDDMVECEVCNKKYKHITELHVRTHGLTMMEYKEIYPNAALTSKAVKERISLMKMGHIVSEETIQKIRETKASKEYGPETYSREFSDETKKKMSESAKRYHDNMRKTLR